MELIFDFFEVFGKGFLNFMIFGWGYSGDGFGGFWDFGWVGVGGGFGGGFGGVFGVRYVYSVVKSNFSIY